MERGGGRGQHSTRGGSNGSRAEPDFLLQWGNRKRLRCVKIQVKGTSSSDKTTVRVDRRVIRSTKDPFPLPASLPVLRRASPLRVLRNSEPSATMRSPQRLVNVVGLANQRTNSRVAGGKNGVAASEEDKKGGGGGGGAGSSSGGSDGMMWPKFVISLSNREKEEDFMVFKGCNRLPQRPKKRAKCIQRTLNLVCPGSWLCDLTQDRYEVREKKISKKRPRGLKAMGSMDSDSE